MMKEITASLAQLVAIIVIMITLAVWTASLSIWANASTTAQSEQLAPATVPAQTLDVAQASR